MKRTSVLAVIALFGGFACVGNRLFLEDFYWYSVPVLLLCSACAWFIGKAFLQLTGLAALKVQPYENKPDGWLFFLIFFLTWSLYWLAFYPAVMSEDSVDQWQQAVGERPLNNWHPVFHTLCIKALISVYKSPAVVAVAQIVFLAGVASSYLVYLSKQGIPFKWLLLFAIGFAIAPQNGIYSITLWKDVAFAGSLLWLMLMLETRNRGIGLIAALIAVALFRHNGLVVYALVLPFCNRRSVVVSLALLLGFKLLIVDRVIPNPPAVKLIAPMHGMAAVLNHSHLPPEVQQKMEAIMPLQEWQSKYSDYSVAGYLFNTHHLFIDNLSQVPTTKVLSMYGRTLVSQPFYIIKERLNGTDYLWNISAPQGIRNFKYITHNLGVQQRPNNLLRSWLARYLWFSKKFCWRVGICNFLLLLLLFRYKRQLRIFMPWLAGVLSLIPAMVDQEYRYVYFVFFLFGFLWFTLLTKKPHPHDE